MEISARDGARDAIDATYLAMIVRKRLCAYDSVQISLHELLNEVYLLEVVKRGRFDDVENRYDLINGQGCQIELHFLHACDTHVLVDTLLRKELQ